ncbi:MAG: glycosyltransferase [Muribaculaceae bacterium]|nr:glycosyltransferase [Muribaculaceae bacterium]
MRFSIIIPTYNRAKLITRTIDSILAQTHTDGIDIIIVDNNSNDNTKKIVDDVIESNTRKDITITYAFEPRQGAVFARNKGIELANNEWIIFFDSDDTMESELIEYYNHAIQDGGDELDLVAARAVMNHLNGSKREKHRLGSNMLAQHIMHSTLCTLRYTIKKDLITQIGGWNNEIRGWDDFELGVRILLASPRVKYIEDKILINIFCQEESISGINYAPKLDQWLLATDTAQKCIEAGNRNDKEYLILLLEYRRLALAGLCTREHSPKGIELYKTIMQRIKPYTLLTPVFAMLYRYVALGLSGGSIIANYALKLICRRH